MGRAGKIARRTFLIGSAAIAGGVAFGVYKLNQTPENPLVAGDGQSILNPYILIDQTGITIITPRAEMGQGVHTSLAAMVAEELDVRWQDIRVEHGPPGAAYANDVLAKSALLIKDFEPRSNLLLKVEDNLAKAPKVFGMQLTGGSSTTADGYHKMRLAGATARQVLIEAAAKRWGGDPAELQTHDGVVISSSGKTATYTDLAAEAALIEPPQGIPLKPKSEWRYLGTSMPRVDMVSKSTGTAQYGIDTRLDGMLFASIKTNPRLGGPMISFDATAAKSQPGVRKIVDLGNGVAVIATNTWLAMQALELIDFTWGDAPYPAESAEINATIAKAFEARANTTLRNDGDPDEVLSNANPDEIITAEYSAAYLAHAAMEPLNATALFEGDKLTIWSGNQAPVYTRQKVAKAVDLPRDQVTLITPLIGGSFGRRLEFDYSIIAARIAREMPGTAIKTTWSREQDMTHDFYRPAAIARFRGLMSDTGPIVFDGKLATQSAVQSFAGRLAGLPVFGPDRVLVEGMYDQPYGIANYRVAGHIADLDLPVGFWRSVGNSHNGFFHECFMDELATANDLDPLAMRLRLMQGVHAPSAKVLERVAAMAGWTGKSGKNIGRGVAFTYSWGTPTAQIVEVRDTPNGIRITKVWAAVDVGVALDPRNIQAQVMSGIIYGLSAAMMGEITFSDGQVEQTNFPDYDALRMDNSPDIAVEVLENKDRITGIGEPGVPPAMPALANALYDLTGKRARSLPLNQHFDFA